MARSIVSAQQSKRKPLNVAIYGQTKGGKTTTAWLLAKRLVEEHGDPDKKRKILFIDTESGRSRFPLKMVFPSGVPDGIDILDWKPPYSVPELTKEIGVWAKDYDVIVLDTFTAFYNREGGTLDTVNIEAATSTRGNTYAAWNKPGQAYDHLLTALTQAPCNIIALFRAKMKYEQIEDDRGKKKIVALGEGPIARQAETAYEFDAEVRVLLDDDQRYAIIEGSRVPTLPQGKKYVGGLDVKEFLDLYMGFMDDLPRDVTPVVVAATDDLPQMDAAEFVARVKDLVPDDEQRKEILRLVTSAAGTTFKEAKSDPALLHELYSAIVAEMEDAGVDGDDEGDTPPWDGEDDSDS